MKHDKTISGGYSYAVGDVVRLREMTRRRPKIEPYRGRVLQVIKRTCETAPKVADEYVTHREYLHLMDLDYGEIITSDVTGNPLRISAALVEPIDTAELDAKELQKQIDKVQETMIPSTMSFTKLMFICNVDCWDESLEISYLEMENDYDESLKDDSRK